MKRSDSTSRRRRASLAVLAAMVAVAAQGASLGWMRGETAAFFTDRDWELVGATLTAALEQATDGETREWSNAQSGARGKMTPLTTETLGGATCRRLRVESVAKGSSSSGTYLFCRRNDGSWGIGQPTG